MSGFGRGSGDGFGRGRGQARGNGSQGNGSGGQGRGRGGGHEKGKKTPFWNFVEEMRIQNRLQSWKQASEQYGNRWSGMDQKARQKYIDMAKCNRNNTEKFTSAGVSLSSILKEQNSIRMAEEEENRQIEMTVRDEKTSTKDKVFMTIHTNYFCVTNSGYYPTCEVAIVKFTLETGIISEFHSLVNMAIPLGYNSLAADASARIGIPVPLPEESETDFLFLISQIISYLEDVPKVGNNSLPPLYTMPENVKSIKNFLRTLCEEAGSPLDTFRVYSVGKLFFELSNNIKQDELPHQCIAESFLIKDIFTYSKGIGCNMHESGGLYPNCSLSIAKRWIYTICNFCCQLLNLDIIPGRHIPPPDPEESATVHASSEQSSRNTNSVQDDDRRSNRNRNDSASSAAQGDEGWTVSRSKRRH